MVDKKNFQRIGSSSASKDRETSPGSLILPVKEAMRRLGIGSTHTMLRAFNQLEERGWIIATSRGAFSGGAKNSTKWELTNWPLVKGAQPKRLFRKWQPR